MGIKHYMNHLITNYPDIVIKPKHIDILCIDLNSILHEICTRIKTKEESITNKNIDKDDDIKNSNKYF